MSRMNWEEIDRLVIAHHKEGPTSSIESLERFLKKWFCIKYNKPFKDPILNDYSIDELIYEYLAHYYMNPDNDPIKKEEAARKANSDMDWVRQQIELEAKKNEIAEKPKKNKNKKKPPLDIPDEVSTKFNID